MSRLVVLLERRRPSGDTAHGLFTKGWGYNEVGHNCDIMVVKNISTIPCSLQLRSKSIHKAFLAIRHNSFIALPHIPGEAPQMSVGLPQTNRRHRLSRDTCVSSWWECHRLLGPSFH